MYGEVAKNSTESSHVHFSQFPLNVSVLRDDSTFVSEEEVNTGTALLTAGFAEIPLVRN